MFFSAVFPPFGLLCLILSTGPGFLPFRMLWFSAGIASVCLGAGYAWLGPRVLRKRADGTLPFSSYLIYWPYFLVTEVSLRLFRALTHEAPYHEIVSGLFLGRRLMGGDQEIFEEIRIHAVLDLTCEFSEPAFMRGAAAYLTLPMLDASAPTAAQAEDGVAFIKRELSSGPVYVHCALGHGRSATLVAAYLLSEKKCASPDAALALIRALRPGANYHPRQRRFLEGNFGKESPAS